MTYNQDLRKKLDAMTDNQAVHIVNAHGQLEVYTAIELRQKLDAENDKANGGEPVALPADEQPLTLDPDAEEEVTEEEVEETPTKKKTPAKKKTVAKKKAPAKKK